MSPKARWRGSTTVDPKSSNDWSVSAAEHVLFGVRTLMSLVHSSKRSMVFSSSFAMVKLVSFDTCMVRRLRSLSRISWNTIAMRFEFWIQHPHVRYVLGDVEQWSLMSGNTHQLAGKKDLWFRVGSSEPRPTVTNSPCEVTLRLSTCWCATAKTFISFSVFTQKAMQEVESKSRQKWLRWETEVFDSRGSGWGVIVR